MYSPEQWDEIVILEASGETIRTTREHPFWVADKGWVKAGDLRPGSCLWNKEGERLGIDGIRNESWESEVYNLQVAGYSTYYVSASEVLVHNKAMRLGGSLPEGYKGLTDWDEMTRRLDRYHGIDSTLASERLHAIKTSAGRGGAADVIFDKTGGVYDPVSRELLGSLTEGGAKRTR
jgi:hypothetical protein